ncbi:hypothetical protein [Pseudomonas edaphica]|jgi:hypothetical protein|uniref:hypothetical protein n=1 Tax=Pseudomonas edaphica TaxID=2006980 RepID=UPI003D1254EA
MLTIPPLRFVLQDNALPIPNLSTRLLIGNAVELVCPFAVMQGDFVNANLIGERGRTYNLSFEVEKDEAELNFLTHRSIIVGKSGTNVVLILRVRRGSDVYFAPNATVSIDAGGIVVPVPGTVWDFADGTFQGWVPPTIYAGGKLHVVNGSVVVDLPSSQVTAAHIITRPISVIAGVTYDFSFDARGGSPAGDGSTLQLRINGSPIGAYVQNITNASTQTGTGTFTAARTETVHLGIFNGSIPGKDNLLFLGNIRMTPRP